MMNFDEYYEDEELNRQLAVARAKLYSAQCFHKRNRRNYIIAIVLGLVLSFLFFAWQLTRPEPVPLENAPVATKYEPVPSVHLESLGEFDLTAYCACEICCGEWAIDRPLDEAGAPIIYTASGAIAESGVTVAVDPDVIPLGTEIHIEGLGVFTAQDTGNFTGNIIDIYFENHETARLFGRKSAEVWEVNYGMSTEPHS